MLWGLYVQYLCRRNLGRNVQSRKFSSYNGKGHFFPSPPMTLFFNYSITFINNTNLIILRILVRLWFLWRKDSNFQFSFEEDFDVKCCRKKEKNTDFEMLYLLDYLHFVLSLLKKRRRKTHFSIGISFLLADELALEQDAERKIGWLLKLFFAGTASFVGYQFFPYLGLWIDFINNLERAYVVEKYCLCGSCLTRCCNLNFQEKIWCNSPCHCCM